MRLKIVAEDGTQLGEFEARSGIWMWQDVLLYASKRWEDVARPASIAALAIVLAEVANTSPQ